jgi:TolA-binding protein
MARILTALAASVAKSVVKPITSIAHAMQKLSVGATAVQLGNRKRRDEIGRMIEAIAIFRHNALEILAMQLSPRQAEEQRALKRREEMASLAAEFEGSVKQIAAQLVEAVTADRNTAEAMAKAAEDTKTKSSSTVDAVVNTRENVETSPRRRASCREPSTNWPGAPTTSSSSPTTLPSNPKAPAPIWPSSPPRWSRSCRSPTSSRALRTRQTCWR